jgi:hypothetical protein
MIRLRFGICAVVLAVAVVAWQPDDAAAKCANHTTTDLVLVIDREITVYSGSPQGNADFQAAFNELDPADIWLVSVLCHEAKNPETGEVVRRQAVHVNTVDDVVRQGEAWLGEIVQAQDGYRGRIGTLAPGLTELLPHLSYHLRYHIQSMSRPLSGRFLMTVAEAGWSTSFEPTGVGTVCHVFSGEIEPPHPELLPDIPRCFVSGEPAPRTAHSSPLQIRIAQ